MAAPAVAELRDIALQSQQVVLLDWSDMSTVGRRMGPWDVHCPLIVDVFGLLVELPAPRCSLFVLDEVL